MTFKSDNTSGACQAVIEKIIQTNTQTTEDAYGHDSTTTRVKTLFNNLFEKEVKVHFMATGTGANCLSLVALTPAYGAIFCHDHAHITTDETNAPELFTGGAKLINLPGEHGKICPTAFENAIYRYKALRPHSAMPAVLSLTQSTEAGTVYSISELETLIALAKKHHLYVHMDGARFANAVVALDESPANLTWRLGIDILSFGGTKNGAIAAEAVVLFNPALAPHLDYQQKRFGQLMSKMRFFSCQFEALLENDLWLKNAEHANRMAKSLSQALLKHNEVKLIHPVETNEIFVTMKKELAETLRSHGIQFYDWSFDEQASHRTYRFVTSFNTSSSEIEKLSALAPH